MALEAPLPSAEVVSYESLSKPSVPSRLSQCQLVLELSYCLCCQLVQHSRVLEEIKVIRLLDQAIRSESHGKTIKAYFEVNRCLLDLRIQHPVKQLVI